jgi:hypothetical protein
MFSDSRFSSGSAPTFLGLTAIIALLFVMSGCSANGSGGGTQFSVVTTSASLPAGSMSTGEVYPPTTLAASGGTAPYTWAVTSATGTFPPGLALSAAGMISGSATSAGTYNFTVTVTDSATHTASGSLSIVINGKLTITSSGTLSTVGAVGSAYTSTALAATGGVGPFTWVVNSGSLPAGLSLSSSGSISGTIMGSAQAGAYNFTAKVTDSQSGTATSGTITITVDAALAITAPTILPGIVGVSYTSSAFTANGGSGTGYNFTVASGALPTSLSLGAATGVITGTPTAANTFAFTVKVTDSLGFTATTGSLSITITPALSVTFAPTSPQSLDQGKTQLVTATVNNDPNHAGVNWSSVTGLGNLSGSTSTTITYNAPATVAAASAATFTATSVTDPTKSATFTVDLVTPPQISTTTMAAGNVNGTYSSPVSMTGGVGPYSWTIVAGPAGLSLSSSTSSSVTVQGTPTVAGANQAFTIKATDSQGLSATSTGLTITIYPTLTITAPTLPTGVVGVTYTASAFTATGGSGTGYNFTVASGSLPTPLALGATTGLVTGSPNAAGTFTFAVKVTDSVNNTATTSSLSITINPSISVTFAPTGPVTLDQGKTQPVTATVTNDPNHAGVTWSAVTGLGSLVGSTTTTTTYDAPATVSANSVAAFTATSITDPTKSATFTVNLVTPPQITTTTMAAGNLNGAYSSVVSMTGGVAPYTWAIVAAPTGLTLGASTTNAVTVQGTPTAAGANQAFTIKVTDAQGLSVTSSGLTITIYATLVLAPPTLPLPTGVVGVSYPASGNFTASGGSGAGYTWSIASGSLPTGLGLSAATGSTTSITAGPPTTAGTYTFTVKVTDSVSNAATSASLSITINGPISVTFAPTSPLTMDQNTSQLVTATVNNDPSGAGVTWSSVVGLGTLTGSTSTTDTYNAPSTVSANSTASFTATSVTDPTKSAIFTVDLVTPPVIASTTFTAGTVGAAYDSSVSEGGGVAPFTWTAVALPAGMSLSSSTSSSVTVQGTPTTAGANQTVTIKVTDAKGLTNTLNSTITINAAASCTTNCVLSGTVTGPWVYDVTVSIAGGATATTTTDSSGNYSFSHLTPGTYTVTPTLSGYTYSPAAPSVIVSGPTTLNFAATPVQTSYSISGTVSYAGTKTGTVYVHALPTGCTSCGSVAGTSIASANGAYTIRGLEPAGQGTNGNGTYSVSVEIDTLGTGIPNASDPSGTSSTVTISASNLTGVDVIVTDPTTPTPVTPTQLSIAPSNNFALVQYQPPMDANGVEIATAYKVYYGTDTNASNGASSPVTYPAQGNHTDVFFLSGLTNGTMYFKLSALVGTTESATTSVVGPVTIGPTTGANTLSGTVTFPGTATGPMYVGVYGNNGVFIETIAHPVSPQAYSVSGVANGTYQNFAEIDMNNDGEFDPPDIENADNNNLPPITISGNTTGNITLSGAAALPAVMTQYQSNGSGGTYQINMRIDWGTKRPVAATLFSGPNVPVPFDMGPDSHQTEQSPTFQGGAVPAVGDAYLFYVVFSDATTQIIPATVSAVLNADSIAQNLSVNPNAPNSATIPLFTWSAPITPPAAYTYSIGVNSQNGPSLNWSYYGNNNQNGIPSTQTTVVYNVDGSASSPSLTIGTIYNWNIQVQDQNSNSASIQSTYTPQ